MASGTVANVLVGNAKLYVAPSGSTLPDFNENPLTIPVAWIPVGYTEKGCEVDYTPTFKDVSVDEELSKIKTILTDEKAQVMVSLAEATVANLNLAISASTVTTTAPNATGLGTVAVGSSGGTGYVVGDVLTVVQGGASGGTVRVTTVASGVVTGVAILTPGTGYSVASGLATTGGTGTGCLINITAIVTQVGLSTLNVGSGSTVEHMVLIVGTSPQGYFRAIYATRAIAVAAVKQAYTKGAPTLIACTFDLLADGNLSAGQRLFHVVDMTAPHS